MRYHWKDKWTDGLQKTFLWEVGSIIVRPIFEVFQENPMRTLWTKFGLNQSSGLWEWNFH